MIGWVEASLYEAISCLARAGKNDLASDLNRLLDTLDFDELEVFRNPASEAIADRLEEVRETYARTLDEEAAEEYAAAFGRAAAKRHPRVRLT